QQTSNTMSLLVESILSALYYIKADGTKLDHACSMQEYIPRMTARLNNSTTRKVVMHLKRFYRSHRIRLRGLPRNLSISALRINLRGLQLLCRRFQEALHSFHVRLKIARAVFPAADGAGDYC